MKKGILIVFYCLCTSGFSFAQSKTLFELEQDLKITGDSILKGSNDSIRISNCNLFSEKFQAFLNYPESFNYEFDSLKTVSALMSSDNLLRIYTWLLPAIDGNHFSYYGFIQLKDKKSGTISLLRLEESELKREEAEIKTYDYKSWIGALYYTLITSKTKGGNIYTLLGWKGNNLSTTIKVIDVLFIEKGIAKFGKPVFEVENKMRNRIIFEFSAYAVMSLKYDKKKKRIVFDHLSPGNTVLNGSYSNYGPDFTYDGFLLSKGKWIYKKNLDLKNSPEFDKNTSPSNVKSKEFYKPEK
ncbi:MAG: hypothetical protein ACHQNT_13665 [Bacteroidia bacterium]